MTTKVLDSKGRLALGTEYAKQTVIIDDSDKNRIIITPAVVIPAKEAWLYKNETAYNLLKAGIEDAKAGRFVDPPDLHPDWLDDVEG